MANNEGAPLHGDRGAYDTVSHADEHARDINDATLLRHLPAPGAAGEVVIDQGAEWQAKALSGDATVAADGTVTVTPRINTAYAEAELDFMMSKHVVEG